MESVSDQRKVISARNASPAFPSLYARLCASDVIGKRSLRHPKADSQVVDVPADNLCVIVHYASHPNLHPQVSQYAGFLPTCSWLKKEPQIGQLAPCSDFLTGMEHSSWSHSSRSYMISAFANVRSFRYIVIARSAAIVRFALFSQRRRANSLTSRPFSIFLSVWFFSFCACSVVIMPFCKDQYRFRRNE